MNKRLKKISKLTYSEKKQIILKRKKVIQFKFLLFQKEKILYRLLLLKKRYEIS